MLYADVWERLQLSKRDRSLVTVSALIAMNRPSQVFGGLVRARDFIRREPFGDLKTLPPGLFGNDFICWRQHAEA